MGRKIEAFGDPDYVALGGDGDGVLQVYECMLPAAAVFGALGFGINVDA